MNEVNSGRTTTIMHPKPNVVWSDANHNPRADVLVGIVNHPDDLTIARDRHWYRIPVSSVEKWLRRRWPPQWLALYQPKVFGADAFAIHYYARVIEIREVVRRDSFPASRIMPGQTSVTAN